MKKYETVFNGLEISPKDLIGAIAMTTVMFQNGDSLVFTIGLICT